MSVENPFKIYNFRSCIVKFQQFLSTLLNKFLPCFWGSCSYLRRFKCVLLSLVVKDIVCCIPGFLLVFVLSWNCLVVPALLFFVSLRMSAYGCGLVWARLSFGVLASFNIYIYAELSKIRGYFFKNSTDLIVKNCC